jgi:hypothetical protein
MVGVMLPIFNPNSYCIDTYLKKGLRDSFLNQSTSLTLSPWIVGVMLPSFNPSSYGYLREEGLERLIHEPEDQFNPVPLDIWGDVALL